MIMKKTVSILSALLLSTAFFMGNACATESLETQYSPLEKQLNLTSDQVNKIATLRQGTQARLDKIDVSNVKQDVIVDMFKSHHWDAKGVKTQLKSISTIQDEARYLRIQYLFDVSQLLTPAQLATLQNLIKQDGILDK